MELIFVIKRGIHVIYSDVSGKGRQARWMLNDLRIEISLRVIELIHEAITPISELLANTVYSILLDPDPPVLQATSNWWPADIFAEIYLWPAHLSNITHSQQESSKGVGPVRLPCIHALYKLILHW